MSDDNPLRFIKEISGVLRLGSGLLGKSAIALSIFLCVILVAVFRLHSDLAIVGTIAMGAVVFFIWFFPVIRFAREHPAEAMLEGAEWSGYQRSQAEAKGYTPSAEELQRRSLPNGANLTLSAESGPKPPEEQTPNG
jgi:hypothetical protein